MAFNEHHPVHFIDPRTDRATSAIAVCDVLDSSFTLHAVYQDGNDITDVTDSTHGQYLVGGVLRTMTLTEFLEQELATEIYGEL